MRQNAFYVSASCFQLKQLKQYFILLDYRLNPCLWNRGIIFYSRYII